ncbi:hypothetical protein EMCRGX_G003628 [Ephydatia muelleri]
MLGTGDKTAVKGFYLAGTIIELAGLQASKMKSAAHTNHAKPSQSLIYAIRYPHKITFRSAATSCWIQQYQNPQRWSVVHCELQNSSVMLSLYVSASVVQSPPVGSNLCDGQGHVVLFEQAPNTFYVTVDTVHITAAIVPLLTMKVYFEEFPSTLSRYGIATPFSMSPDGFDAMSVQNVGSTYIIVSWDLPTDSNGILINFNPPVHCDSNLLSMRTALLGDPLILSRTLMTFFISVLFNKIINPDKSFASLDPMCILLLQLSSLLVEHTAPNIHDSVKSVQIQMCCVAMYY